MAMPRTGSSMVAGIFAAHGVWHGKCRPADQWNAKGYWENTAIDDAMKRRWPRKVVNCTTIEPQEDFYRELALILHEQEYESGHWMMKMSAAYWPAWVWLNPYWVCIRRNEKNVLRSCERSRMIGNDRERIEKIIAHHSRQMDVLAVKGAVEVLTDEIVSGDLSSLERAFEHCGLVLDPAIANGFIDRTLWHHE